MYEYNPTPQKTGKGIKIVCIVLALALAGSIIFFGNEISALKKQIADTETASADGNGQNTEELERKIKALEEELKAATSKIENLSYSPNEELPDTASLVDVSAEVKSSVVLIRVTVPEQKISNGFFGYTIQGTVEEGTGIILSEDGYIATNEHVISTVKENSTAYIDVIMDDGTSHSATLIGSDSTNDLAVVKIDVTGLTPIKIGSSSALKVGQVVLAVGNPLGSEYAGSVTMGIVSALERQVSEENTSQLMIQHDAAINPGNSGGALVNTNGELVGINTSKISSTSVEGLGFAIPVDYAMPILEQLIEYGYVRGRVTVGLAGETLSARYASYYGLPEGLLVTDVVTDGGADLAGIQVYDVITEFGGRTVTSMNDIEAVKTSHSVGDVVEITYYSYSSRQYVTANLILMEDKSN